MTTNTQKSLPKVFYRLGDLHPIKMTLLCEYPFSTPDVYAVYLNNESKLPERVHISSIGENQYDLKTAWLHVFKLAKSRLDLIIKRMKEEEIQFSEDIDLK